MWRRAVIAEEQTHHEVDGAPLYSERFDEVLAFHEPGLAPVRRGADAWHIDERGAPAYRSRFLRAFGFYEARAAVVAGDGWHHIRPDGTSAYARRLAWCGNYQGQRCAVRDVDGRYFHLDPDGDAAYVARWSYAGDYRGGIAVAQAASGKSTHIDQDGRPIHGVWFRDLDVFHKGAARARDDGGWTHVDRAGRALYGRRFAMVEPFYNGQARVERFDGAIEIVDLTGQAICVPRPPSTAR